MSGWLIFWIVVFILIVLAIAANLRDIIRYMKIRFM